ncbi:hypothetical protein IE53DRAFT_153538 [Violaceomyces palustris]|uniref:Uncharacterized protein n=1 Tax=Violaceomyces palustris TaxID=1673888 RepID=A0ACD0P6A7_9BASI|nr:hypothetical protein IE53DRAFT_153538 [Violaceomyces palustris]
MGWRKRWRGERGMTTNLGSSRFRSGWGTWTRRISHFVSKGGVVYRLNSTSHSFIRIRRGAALRWNRILNLNTHVVYGCFVSIFYFFPRWWASRDEERAGIARWSYRCFAVRVCGCLCVRVCVCVRVFV